MLLASESHVFVAVYQVEKSIKLVIAENIFYEFDPFPLFYELFSLFFVCIYFDCLLEGAYRKGQISSWENF